MFEIDYLSICLKIQEFWQCRCQGCLFTCWNSPILRKNLGAYSSNFLYNFRILLLAARIPFEKIDLNLRKPKLFVSKSVFLNISICRNRKKQILYKVVPIFFKCYQLKVWHTYCRLIPNLALNFSKPKCTQPFRF